jgi:hypothetical protein
MSMTARGWAATVTISAMVLAGSAAPARAADPVRWRMAPCVTLLAMRPTPEALYNTVEGWVSQCRPVVRAGGFRIATYRADQATGTAPGYNVRLFDSTRVGKVSHFGVDALPQDEGVFGICVLAGHNERVACLSAVIVRGAEGYEDTLSPLDTDDPLVDKAVVTTPYTGARAPNRGVVIGGLPACGSCF